MNLSRIAAIIACAILAAPVMAQTVPGKFSYPPVNTIIETTDDIAIVESVSGFDAVLRSRTSKEVFGFHAQFIAGRAVGNTLRYDRAAVEAIWPLEVGKSISYESTREGGAWQTTWKVLRTESITVPAGTFFAYVIEERQRGLGNSSYRMAALRWYAPEIGFTVRLQRKFEHNGTSSAWDLLKITPPQR